MGKGGHTNSLRLVSASHLASPSPDQHFQARPRPPLVLQSWHLSRLSPFLCSTAAPEVGMMPGRSVWEAPMTQPGCSLPLPLFSCNLRRRPPPARRQQDFLHSKNHASVLLFSCSPPSRPPTAGQATCGTSGSWSASCAPASRMPPSPLRERAPPEPPAGSRCL